MRLFVLYLKLFDKILEWLYVGEYKLSTTKLVNRVPLRFCPSKFRKVSLELSARE